MKGILQRHYKLLSDSISRSIGDLRKRCDKKSIHRFRVLIKKFRALSLLLENMGNKKLKSSKGLRKLKKLFNEAGRIRDVQVQTGIMKEFKILENKLSEQKIEIRKSKNRFLKKLEKFDERKSLKKMTKNLGTGFSTGNKDERADVLRFSKRYIRKAIVLADSNSLHNARIRLKTAHFCLEIIKRHPEARSIIATIDPIEQKLGRWQDCIITNRIITNTSDSGRPGEKVQTITDEISRLESQLRKDFYRLKKIIN